MSTFQHHAANISAVAVPVLSWHLSLPEVIQYATLVMGMIWYGVLFYDRFFGRGKRNDKED